MHRAEVLTNLYEGDPIYPVYNPCAVTLDAATVAAGSPEREEMHIMHAFATLRHISGAQQQAVPGFAAAYADTVRFHLTYFGILIMPGAPALNYCVDVRAHTVFSILADVGERYPQCADNCLAFLCMY